MDELIHMVLDHMMIENMKQYFTPILIIVDTMDKVHNWKEKKETKPHIHTQIIITTHKSNLEKEEKANLKKKQNQNRKQK